MPRKIRDESSESSEYSTYGQVSSDYSSDDITDSTISESESSSETDIKVGTYEPSTGRFAHGKLDDLIVVMMVENGYINATNICNENDKSFEDWLNEEGTEELISEIQKLHPESELIMTVTEGIDEVRGTYVHPDMINHVISWCSPKYALKVSRIVNEYHIKQAIEEKNRLLGKKQDKIDRMSKKLDKMLDTKNKLLDTKKDLNKMNKKLLDDMKDLKKSNKKLLRDNKKLLANTKYTNMKLDDLVEEKDARPDDYVVDGNPDQRHILAIFKTNGVVIRNKKRRRSDYQYVALRVMKKCYAQRKAQLQKEYPDGEILKEIKYTPNSMNLWGRIRKKVGTDIVIKGSRFNRVHGYTEGKLLRTIERIHSERYD